MSQPYRSPSRDLGGLERRFRSPPPVRPILIVFMVFGLPGIALLTGFQSAPGQVFAGDRWTNGAIGVVLVAIAAVVIRQVAFKSTLAIALHENGLAWTERGLTRKILWDEIADIVANRTERTASGVTVARTDVYRLRLTDGTERAMTHMLGDVVELGTRVHREVAARRAN